MNSLNWSIIEIEEKVWFEFAVGNQYKYAKWSLGEEMGLYSGVYH